MNKHMTQDVAIKSAWMILEGLGFSREINGDLEKTVTAVYESAPAADVAPVRRGNWIPAQDYSNGNEDIECSSCGEWFKSLELCGRLGEPNYCPVCGSKNKDGGQEA